MPEVRCLLTRPVPAPLFNDQRRAAPSRLGDDVDWTVRSHESLAGRPVELVNRQGLVLIRYPLHREADGILLDPQLLARTLRRADGGPLAGKVRTILGRDPRFRRLLPARTGPAIQPRRCRLRNAPQPALRGPRFRFRLGQLPVVRIARTMPSHAGANHRGGNIFSTELDFRKALRDVRQPDGYGLSLDDRAQE